MPTDKRPDQLTGEEALQVWGVDAGTGLSDTEAEQRLTDYGPNELVDRARDTVWQILVRQFGSVMVWLLLISGVISYFLGDLSDAIAILAIVILNALLGFVQEYRAEQAVAALKRMALPLARVRRAGAVKDIESRLLVPGDVVLLEAGNAVPADGRLIEAQSLRVQEAALTGESAPIEKQASFVGTESDALGDRRNMVYAGTYVVYGRAAVLITATGMQTELGRIASLIESAGSSGTPLQRRLDDFGKRLAIVAVLLVAVIFIVGLIQGDDLRVLVLTAVSMAVAAVPEGLPAVVTIALALGSQRMLQRHALVRKLAAVETLGGVTVICSDKTGTLTQNRMTVVQAIAGEFQADPRNSHEIDDPALQLLLVAGALCNDTLAGADTSLGDPTEVALVNAAQQVPGDRASWQQSLPRIDERAFDSDRKLMTTVHQLLNAGMIPAGVTRWLAQRPGAGFTFTKGAPDVLLDRCRYWWDGQSLQALEGEDRNEWLRTNDDLAAEGMRVLAVGGRFVEDGSDWEQEVVLFGLCGMVDPPRPEAAEAVAVCRAAGIRPVLITGDHPITALRVARDIGIDVSGGTVTGPELAAFSEDQLTRVAARTSVYARVAPEHKLAIVRSLQQQGQTVAMTGDGVNDAPALRQADIGVAMGKSGTDVAREAANMVLRDDNFATIVAAVEEGRVLYDNLRKFVRFLLTSNTGEIAVMVIGPLLGMPLPLVPLQILWMNLVTDGLPALALGVEPAEPDVMRRPPRSPSEGIVGGGMTSSIVRVGLALGLVALGAGYVYWRLGREEWQTMTFTVLVMSQMALALAVRSERESVWRVGLFSNRPLLGAVLLTTVLQLAVIYLPFCQQLMHTVPLRPLDLLLAALLSSVVFWIVEVGKWWSRWRTRLTVGK